MIDLNIKNYYITKEQQILYNIHEIFKGEEMIDQHNVGQYRIDLYFTKYKIAIECDENDHIDRDIEYEKKRENYITNTLKCTFIRFNPDDDNFNINKICNEIFKLIIKS